MSTPAQLAGKPMYKPRTPKERRILRLIQEGPKTPLEEAECDKYLAKETAKVRAARDWRYDADIKYDGSVEPVPCLHHTPFFLNGREYYPPG